MWPRVSPVYIVKIKSLNKKKIIRSRSLYTIARPSVVYELSIGAKIGDLV